MNIAVASGKGGTGKTLVATNLFWTLQKEGIPCTLVDCDAEEPNVTEFIKGELLDQKEITQHIPVIDPEKCVFCGKCHEYCNYHAIVYLPPAKYIKVVEDLCHDCGACTYACMYGAITEKVKKIGEVRFMNHNCHAQIVEGRAEIGVYSPVPVIKKSIQESQDSILNILDSPPGISCPFIATVSNADYVVLVTEPTPFGLNDLKLSVETLRQLGKSFGVVVNRSKLGNDGVYQYLRLNNIDLLLEIPMDRKIAKVYSEGRMLVDEMPIYKEMFHELFKKIQILCS